MRALSAAVVLLMMSVGAFAEVEKVPARHFSLVIKGKYAKRFVTVFKEKKSWICVTESLPSFVAKGDPLAGFDWGSLKGQPPAGGCRDVVEVDNRLMAAGKSAVGCLTDPGFRDLVDQLDRNCRAE